MYPQWSGNPDYTRIVNAPHFDRLNRYVEDAIERGAKAVSLGEAHGWSSASRPQHSAGPFDRVFPPVILLDVNESMLVMQNEIFGPVLPVLTYGDVKEALAYVNCHERPLALYYFDNSKRRVDQVLHTTLSGGVTVNDVIYHIAQHNLPFGGVGSSGMGQYHGRAGFATFSKEKGVFLQSRFSALKFLRPPYGPLAERVIRFLLRS